jgi:hypothetical protein
MPSRRATRAVRAAPRKDVAPTYPWWGLRVRPFKHPSTAWPEGRGGRWRHGRGPEDVRYVLSSCSAQQACGEACGFRRVQALCPFKVPARADTATNGIKWPAQDVIRAEKLAELAVQVLRRQCTAVQPWLGWRALLYRAVDKILLRETRGRAASGSLGETVQVYVRAGGDAIFSHRVPWDMPINGVKRLLVETWCSKLAKPPGNVAVGVVERLWQDTWLKCNGRSLTEESTLRACNVGADATIDLQVCCPLKRLNLKLRTCMFSSSSRCPISPEVYAQHQLRCRGGGRSRKTPRECEAPMHTRPQDAAQAAAAEEEATDNIAAAAAAAAEPRVAISEANPRMRYLEGLTEALGPAHESPGGGESTVRAWLCQAATTPGRGARPDAVPC